MSLAEIILRIGGGIGGWIIGFAHAVIIGSLRYASCDPRNDNLWQGTLFLAVLAALGTLTQGLDLEWRKSFKWLALGLVPIGIYAALGVVSGLIDTTFGGVSLCVIAGALPEGVDLTAYPATTLQRVWPLVQLFVLSAAVVQALRHWQSEDVEAHTG